MESIRPSILLRATQALARRLRSRIVPVTAESGPGQASQVPRGHGEWRTAGEAASPPLRIALATEEHLDVVLGLIEDARSWLWAKNTDQWAVPWPTEQARDERVRRGLRGRKTWIVWDGDIPAATVTMTPRKNAAVWSKQGSTCNLAERAVFVHRLITARKYAGTGLGADLIDWAGLRGRRLYGAKWIRIDVWRTNEDLHRYYRSRGFEPCGFCQDPSYPSGALFQKPVSSIRKPRVSRFIESPEPPLASSGDEEPRHAGQAALTQLTLA